MERVPITAEVPFKTAPLTTPPVRTLTPMVVAKRFVEEAVVAKKLVVVAEVPVALMKVKFWRVLEPVSKRLERVVSPPVAVSVPVKLAVDEIVWPLIKPEVMAPVVRAPLEVMLPVVKLVEKRLVDEAVVAKELVEVAFVVVESPVTKRLPETCNLSVGTSIPIPTLPLSKIERAETVEVAVPAIVVVAR
jgi:hypothetical protein